MNIKKIMEALKNNLKYILNVVFIVLIAWLTLRLLFSGEEFSTIIADIHLADLRWIAVGVVFVFFFVAGESVIIKYMLHMFKDKVPFMRCLKYSFIGFFFSCITPSASGGQPAQMFYMKKDGIKIGYSSLIMLIIAIAYKSVLVVLSILYLVFDFSFIKFHVGKLGWLLAIGFVLNVAYIFGLIFVFFKPLWARKMGIKLVNLLTGWKIVKQKNNEKYVNKIKRIADNYIVGAEYIKNNIGAVIKIFLITVVQRFLLFGVTWIVYKAYGLTGASFIGICGIQVMICTAVEMLPLPGAVGVTEGCFTFMYMAIFGENLVRPAMLLSRGLSFYVLLIMSAAVTFAAHIIMIRKSKKMGVIDDDESGENENANEVKNTEEEGH